MFDWLRKTFGGSEPQRKRRRKTEGEFTHRNPLAKLPSPREPSDQESKPTVKTSASMPPVSGKFALKSDTTIQTRRAQAVEAQLATAVRRACEASPHVIACYLLDARQPETGEIALIIAVTLDDEAAHMDFVAQQFQTMLRQFPTHASTYIMSSEEFAHVYAGTEFYVKRAA